MAKSKKGSTFGEKCIFYGSILGAIFCFGSAVPFVPWRYARVDTNVGDRFVMERRYTLMGLSNNFGKNEGWLKMSKKLQRKVEEFGRPSPLSAVLGTVATIGGVGGAAVGCSMWTICKEHVNVRYIMYNTTGNCGIAAMAMLSLGALSAAATVIFLNMEPAGKEKKKKKKKKDSMEPSTKTMIAAIFAFLLPTIGCTTFICMSGHALEAFKETAYYPYAGAHVGSFTSGFGSFINWMVMMIAINRVYPCCGKKKGGSDSDDELYGEGGPPPAAYGAPPGYGAPGYGPAYGAPYGPPPPQ